MADDRGFGRRMRELLQPTRDAPLPAEWLDLAERIERRREGDDSPPGDHGDG